MGRQDTGLLTGNPATAERAARYDAWFQTPLGVAMDRAEARAVLELTTTRPANVRWAHEDPCGAQEG